MARETKAERLERELNEKKQRLEELQKTWPQRLLNLAVDYANIPGFTVKRENDMYHFIPSDNIYGFDSEFKLPFDVTKYPEIWNTEYNMDEAERAIRLHYDMIAEENRKIEVKKAALSKLNDEEKRLLGIIK